MPLGVPWPVLGSVVSGLGSLALLPYLWPYRNRPGARMWFGVLATMALWSLSYGVALLVFEPGLRLLLEAPIWLAINWLSVFFLGFALSYTGRARLLRSKWMGLIVLFELTSTGVVATNSIHHLVWSNYHIDPVFGVATVSFTPGPWLFLQWAVMYLCVGTGIVFLVETVASYGPLYRTQAAVIAFSPVLPAGASLLWLFELGPVPQLNLTPLMFLPHLVLDVYALFRSDMFELSPATRRAGERAAIDDLGSAVLVLDDEGRVIDLNDEASRVLDLEEPDALGQDAERILDTELGLGGSAQRVSLRTNGERAEFKIVTSPFETNRGTVGGYTLVLQDVTTERQRKQRLEVLNRILRHNLRNDMNVVQLYADELSERSDGPEETSMATAIEEKSSGLVDLAEKARAAAQTLDELDDERVRVAELLDAVAVDYRDAYPDATVRVAVPDDLVVETNPRILELVFENAIENGLEHAAHDEPTVEVTFREVSGDGDSVVVAVSDDGPGVPDHEVAVVTDGEEDALNHGSGLGLWLIRWGTTALGGDLSFTTGDAGTTVEIRLPGRLEG
ncbi:histidine kinase N-terminal 7TM domain-containing protein [Haloarculaceae archaeon H-GB2-1]|nr:histidine kinase N-terminal 7TM domain-containing protein [Haloarculaceae archaeon H-GB1-1]MEA5387721.1 histidine kinase N-terminal 7TM domain-containing protein [Haloarculaceae archaeon H-GB11]MEA5409212.1 histidine kinase N-terminal 7TM domain-containing protein [Haloarculaceae archaeon H-GB2-1]